ncbi:MAG: Tfp pilus assembly protein FimT/FimU [Phycisphaerales bacterium]
MTHERRSRGRGEKPARRRAGFTLVELLITTFVIAIATAIVMPMLGANDATYVDTGVSLMVADMDYAQSTAINNPNEMALVCFDPANDRWWVAPESTPATPYTKQYSGEPYDTTLGVGRAEFALGVTFTLTNVSADQIAYNAYGQLKQTLNPSVTLTRGQVVQTITVDAETGFLAVN